MNWPGISMASKRGPPPCRASTTTTSSSRPRTAPVRVLKVMHPMRDRRLRRPAVRRPEGRSPNRTPACLSPPSFPTGTDGPGRRQALGDGTPRLVWMLTYLAGRPIAVGPARDAGQLLERAWAGPWPASIRALSGFAHPSARRELKWDLRSRRLDPRSTSGSSANLGPTGPGRGRCWPATTPKSRRRPAAPAPERRLRRRQRAQRPRWVEPRPRRRHVAGPHRLRRHAPTAVTVAEAAVAAAYALLRARPTRSRPSGRGRRRLPPRPAARRGGDRHPRRPRPARASR
ncbi:MAG: hypothetical protein MZV64_12490 [Ignavibacteriales bacterium]|nr:hypothetical protein [Ignavibacteriales bacterium]